jgi:hypothetical protein
LGSAAAVGRCAMWGSYLPCPIPEPVRKHERCILSTPTLIFGLQPCNILTGRWRCRDVVAEELIDEPLCPLLYCYPPRGYFYLYLEVGLGVLEHKTRKKRTHGFNEWMPTVNYPVNVPIHTIVDLLKGCASFRIIPRVF